MSRQVDVAEAHSGAPVERAMTVLGAVPSFELGVTLPHEHLLCDARVWARTGSDHIDAKVSIQNRSEVHADPLGFRDNLVLNDVSEATTELAAVDSAGGRTVVDVTPEGIGRDPVGLAAIAHASGLNIVAGCGYYIARAHPPRVSALSVDALAEEFISEITNGIGESGVRPGVIGELGTSNPIEPAEAKVLRAAAFAQVHSGYAICVHLHMGARTGHQVLDILEAAGANLNRVVLFHLDSDLSHDSGSLASAVDYHASLGARGCFLAYDCCGREDRITFADGTSFQHPTDRVRVEALKALITRGLGDSMLVSQDVCKKMQLVAFGGTGYSHVLRAFGDLLNEYDIESEQIETLFRENPHRMLIATPPRNA